MRRVILKYFLVLFSRTRLAVAVATGLLVISVTAFAAVEYTPVAGGSGGTFYSLSCGSDKALVGIDGRADNLVDRVQGLCVQINYDGSWQGNWTTTGTAGGSGGTSYGLRCPSGSAVTGLTGYAGSYLNKLTVKCQGLSTDGSAAGSVSFSRTVGGSGGNWFTLGCPSFKSARLIQGRAATWIDAIGLGCDSVKTLKVLSVGAPPKPVRVGQTASAIVTMSLIPAANAIIDLMSSNAGVVTVPSNVTAGTGSTQIIASITPTAPGCTKITASYKRSSASSSDMIVHSATSPDLSLAGPTEIRVGSSATVTVTIPSPAPADGKTIVLYNLDSNIVTMPYVIRISPKAVSAVFQVTAGQTQGCARIKAVTATKTVPYSADVTHTLRVVQ